MTTAPDLTDLPAPPNAAQVSCWTSGSDTAWRSFAGTVRVVGAFAVRIEGIQWRSGSCARWASLLGELPAVVGPESLRQMASALSAAAAEIEARA